MRPMDVVILVSLIMVTLSSCSKNEIISQSDFGSVRGIQWRLVALDMAPEGTIPLEPSDRVFLVFNDSGRIQGSSEGLCGNYYTATYTLGPGNSIRVDSLVSTEAVCPNSKYWDYIHRFDKVNSLETAQSRLNLFYDGRTQRLVFEIAH
jgi:heat shock protein HslJ